MTGTTRLFGVTKDAAAKIKREMQSRLYLESSLGVASNKLVSKIASTVIKPVGLQDVEIGDEKKFVAPLTTSYLPHINQQIRDQLLEFNIQFIREIAEIPLRHLTVAFGRLGLWLHQAANGIDSTPVRAPQAMPNIFEEQTLAEDSNDFLYLRSVLHRLVEKAALQLRQSGRTAKKFSLEIFYSDQKSAFGQQKMSAASNLTNELFLPLESLFWKILTRRTRVRKLSVRFFQLAPAARQLSLFKTATDTKTQHLSPALDEIRSKFGHNAIQLAMVQCH